MARPKWTNLVLMDLAGGGLCAVLAGAIIWYATGPQHHMQVELEALTRASRQTGAELADVSATLDQRRTALAELADHLRREGAMPSRTPLERDLNTLTTLAQQTQVTIARITPLPSQEYPGLLELRFSCEASGTLPDIVAFFRAVERHPFWTDIGYLNVRPAPATDEKPDEKALLSLTFVVSLFSSSSSVDAATPAATAASAGGMPGSVQP